MQMLREMHGIFETHKARVTHKVHAQSLNDTHGLQLYVTTMTTSSEGPMCKTVFSNLATARVHEFQPFRTGRCFVNRSARAHESECSALCNETRLLRMHVKQGHLSKWSPRHKYIRADITNIGIPYELKQFNELKVLTENVYQREHTWRPGAEAPTRSTTKAPRSQCIGSLLFNWSPG